MTRSEFNNKVDQFFAKYDDRKVDFDGIYGAQCVDEIKFYFQEVIGIEPRARGNAVNYWDNCPELTQIPNTPTGVPEKGDIVIWNAKIGSGSGHIAIAKGVGDTSNFDSMDQNWPVGSGCHFQAHNYNNVIGWLRAKNIDDAEYVAPAPVVIPEPVVIPPVIPETPPIVEQPAPDPVVVVNPPAPVQPPVEVVATVDPANTTAPIDPVAQPMVEKPVEPIVEPSVAKLTWWQIIINWIIKLWKEFDEK